LDIYRSGGRAKEIQRGLDRYRDRGKETGRERNSERKRESERGVTVPEVEGSLFISNVQTAPMLE